MKTLNYEIKSINSSVENIEFSNNLSEILNTKLSEDKYTVIVYLDYEVKVGLCNRENKFNFIFSDNSKVYTQYVQKLRVFNENEELYLWRSNGFLRGRLRKDNSGNEVEYVDVKQVLFGTTENINSNNDFITISESKRGIKITLPNNNFKVDDEKNRVAIKTRNYIGYNEVFQATYTDVRFIKFVQLGE